MRAANQKGRLIGVMPVTLSLIAGLALGLWAGYYGGWADHLIMRVMDVLFAFPAILLAIGIVAALGPGITNAILAITVVEIPTVARIVRAPVLSLREQEFVLAARVLGADDPRILLSLLHSAIPRERGVRSRAEVSLR